MSPTLQRLLTTAVLVAGLPVIGFAEETFVSIHKVVGNKMSVTRIPDGIGRGPGRRDAANTKQAQGQPGRFGRRGRGRRGGNSSSTQVQTIIVTVPATAKITSGLRERRTFKFRAGAELAGGLKNQIFRNIQKPLSARIVTQNNRISEVNVILETTDINQSNTDANGKTVIAIRPKRPPAKRK